MNSSARVPRLAPPPYLVEECKKGECVLYVGGGLSAEQGGPTGQRFLVRLLEWTVKSKFVSTELARSYNEAIKQNHFAPVSDGIVSALEGSESAVHDYLRKIFSKQS